jgi:LysM repeat protein
VSVLVDSVYIVTPGMVLDSISVRFGIEKERLKRINQLNINRVLRGDTILIPFRSISR